MSAEKKVDPCSSGGVYPSPQPPGAVDSEDSAVPTPVITRQDVIAVLREQVSGLQLDLAGAIRENENLLGYKGRVESLQSKLSLSERANAKLLQHANDNAALLSERDALKNQIASLRGPSLFSRLTNRVSRMMGGGKSLIGNAFEPMVGGVVGLFITLKFLIKNSCGVVKLFTCAALRSIGCFTVLPLNFADCASWLSKKGGDFVFIRAFTCTFLLVGVGASLHNSYQAGAWQKFAFQHPEFALRSAQFISTHFGNLTNFLYTLGFGALCTNILSVFILIARNRRNRIEKQEVEAGKLSGVKQEGVGSEAATDAQKHGITTPDHARQIMGKNFFGVEEAQTHFKIKPTAEQLFSLSEIPFSETELKECKDKHILVAVFPISINDLHSGVDGKLFHNQDWYNNQAFANERGEVGWHLISKTPVKNSTSKTWNEQQKLIQKNDEVPTAQVMVYAIIGHLKATGELLFENIYVRCSSVASGRRVSVGCFDASGLYVHNWGGDAYCRIGVASSRKFPARSKA